MRPVQYYSEYGEDQWIDRHLSLPGRGFYLDLGAGHPEQNSNTAFLRDRGWMGLAIDGVRQYGPHWVGRQQFIHAILSPLKEVRFNHVRENSSISRIVGNDSKLGEMENAHALSYVLGCTLGSASPPITHIDFLSIDLEGHEFDVFNTFDWKVYNPEIIVAEYNTLGIGEDFRLRDLLMGNGYSVRHQTVANLIYSR